MSHWRLVYFARLYHRSHRDHHSCYYCWRWSLKPMMKKKLTMTKLRKNSKPMKKRKRPKKTMRPTRMMTKPTKNSKPMRTMKRLN